MELGQSTTGMRDIDLPGITQLATCLLAKN